jgi:hypothetical protein
MDILDQLKYPFDPKVIHWRIGARNQDKTKGIALAYLDARDVMKRLDMVCPDWQCRYSHNSPSGTICEIGIRLDGEWLWRADGAGETDVEGTKGGMSDAFKRAAVRWGVGRYLYYLENKWADLESGGKKFAKDSSAFNLPKFAIPDPTLERLHNMWAAIAEVKPYIEQIKEGIETGDLAHASRAYNALSEESRTAVNIAPTKGGPFTTEERNVIRSAEFKEE